MMGLSFGHIVIILVIALLIFGPSRLPGLGSALGESIRGFKKAIDGENDSQPVDLVASRSGNEGTADQEKAKNSEKV